MYPCRASEADRLVNLPPTRQQRRSVRRALALTILLLAGLALSLAPGGVAPPAPDPGENDLTLTSRTIWSYYTENPPPLDDPTASVWDYPLEVLGLVPGHVALSGGTSLEIRSLYTDTDIYFRIMWHDVVENSRAPRWVYHDGNWTFTSPFEDGLGIYFPIADPEGLFLEEGCMRTCHMTDWENPQNQERKFTHTAAEKGDMWFWSAGLSNPWDFAIDTYVTNKPSENNVGYYEDPEMGLDLIKNRHLTEYMEYVYLSRPVYMQDPNAEPRWGPALIARGEEVLFDQAYYDPDKGDTPLNPITHEPWRNGDVVGGYVLDRLPEEGLGEIDARGTYDVLEQQWSLVLRRPLDTGDPVHDVIFDDLTRTYTFGLSLFGDIMGGGDASQPFIEPEEGGDRCVMNKVTNTIGLRFRPVLQAARAEPGAPGTWDADGWGAVTSPLVQELIHRSGEIHDPWDWLNVSAACDGDRLYVYLRHADPNGSEDYAIDVGWLTPGMVSVEETYHMLDWDDVAVHVAVAEGTSDLWSWTYNASSDPEGTLTDMGVEEGVVSVDDTGPDDVEARTWRAGGARHVVLTRQLETTNEDGDITFHDMARTYVMRVAVRTSDRGEWLKSLPLSFGFAPDPGDRTAAAPLAGVAAIDGGDSDILLSWDASGDEGFGQYRVYIDEEPFTGLDGMVPSARISDVNITELHVRGIRPDTTHHIAVVAVDDNRNLPSTVTSIPVEVTDGTPPSRLTGLKVFDNLDSDLLITWEASDSPDVNHYEVYLEQEAFEDASPLEPVDVVRGMRASSYRAGGLQAGTTYHAAVVAVDWTGNAIRNVASVSGVPTDVTAPPEVRGLDVSTPQAPDSEGELRVSWRSSTSLDISHYNVYISLTPIEELNNFAPWGAAPSENTSLTVTGLRPGTKYYLAVTAVDRTGHEGPSKYTTSGHASTADPPETVRGLVAVQAGEASARLDWLPVNVTGAPVVTYRVHMSLTPITDLSATTVQLVGNVSASPEPTFLATSLEVGTTYYFAVSALDSRGRTSLGPPQVASVTLPVPQEPEESLWEAYGPAVTGLLVLVIAALLVFVAISRHRKYGRLLSRRPSWEQKVNGGGKG